MNPWIRFRLWARRAWRGKRNRTRHGALSMRRIRVNRMRRFFDRDKTTWAVLALSALVGLLVGLVAIGFERGVDWVFRGRKALVSAAVADHWPEWGVWALAAGASALLGLAGYALVRFFAPEAGGSGIPEIEGALNDLRPARWRRVLPVKFLGGMATLGAGMVLGREGPTVQLGGNTGRMVADLLRQNSPEARHTLLATGAAAGLSAAFNAPLAGILFIIEEMRPQFRYNLVSIHSVFIGVIVSTVVHRWLQGEHEVFEVGQLGDPHLDSLWLFLALGLAFGFVGVAFIQLALMFQDFFLRLYRDRAGRFLLTGAVLAGFCGWLELFRPHATGGGFSLIPWAIMEYQTAGELCAIFAARVLMTLLCFCSGAPGGVFAPMLTLGTLGGTAFGELVALYLPEYGLRSGMFAVAGMGALFAAVVRAPLTGIVLVLEMTENYQLILPMIVTCLGATLLAQAMGGKPLYSLLLDRTLQRQARKDRERLLARRSMRMKAVKAAASSPSAAEEPSPPITPPGADSPHDGRVPPPPPRPPIDLDSTETVIYPKR